MQSLPAISAIIILKGQLEHTNPIITSFRLFIIGSILAAIAGPSDFAWHRAFGVDGLLSPTHFVLATGIVINSVAVVIGLGRMDTQLRAMRQKRMIKFVMIPAFGSYVVNSDLVRLFVHIASFKWITF